MMGIIRKMVAKNTKVLTATVLAAVLSSMALVQAPAYAEEDERFFFFQRSDIADTLSANGFGTLLFALDTAGLVEALESMRVTVFAPTDDVFDGLADALCYTDAVALATALIDVGLLDDVLTYHAASGQLGPQQILENGGLTMLSGATVDTGVDAFGFYVEGASNGSPSRITAEGIVGRRNIVYPIDQILLPPGTPDLSNCP